MKNDEDGVLRVGKLAPDGLAMAKGLNVGDVVTEINGTPVMTTDKFTAAKMLREAKGDLIITTVSADESIQGISFDMEASENLIFIQRKKLKLN